MTTWVRATTAHAIPERASIRIAPGDEVTVRRRDTTWPAFVFVETDDGEGWVPERFLATDAGRTTVLTSYDTTELATEVGERLAVVATDHQGGWVWCRNADGAEGWVPMSTVEPDR